MEIKRHDITVRDLVNGYKDSAEAGVVGYGGKLDIRPAYQREFVYKDKQRAAVIDSIRHDFPLNVMYWVVKDDGGYEVLDGQQRTISIGQYVNGDYSINGRYFHNLTDTEKDQILDYSLMVYFCEGNDRERLDWFRIINIAGEKLTEQELRNAVYAGPWLSEAKLKFSKPECVAYKLSGDKGHLLKGRPIRQEYLETTLKWISYGDIEGYMAQHQHDANADAIWTYYKAVIAWVRKLFPKYRREMAGLPWGDLYNTYQAGEFNADILEDRVTALMNDDDVTRKAGIYAYVLSGEERHLSIRAFDKHMKRQAYERQKGICPFCKDHFKIEDMEADHITPWHEGGKTTPENCQMLCERDNRSKGSR